MPSLAQWHGQAPAHPGRSALDTRRGITWRAASKVKEKVEAPKEAKAAPAEVVITPRSESWPEWYQDVIAAADLVDDVPVRGCKILRPSGFAIWEAIQGLLDPKLKAMGVQNAYFPLLIPVSFLSKEAAHVDGFAKECAVVTHHRLRSIRDEKTGVGAVDVDPDSKLAEPYVVRPTSETVVWHMYGQWIKSYRDLPLKMNQWVNVLRWERRTKPFLRSAEFLWQEGHTAHATREEADAQAREVLDKYVELARGRLLLPLVPGRKSENERFAGADETYTIEALTQNGMAIQAGTSHFLGQNFAKAFNVTYMTAEQESVYVWASSWGVSTRLIGATIMVHSDDTGLVLPPAVAAVQVVIVVIFSKKPEQQAAVLDAAAKLEKELQAAGIRVHLDGRTNLNPGPKYFEWERKGVPLRLELGMRDLEKGTALAKMRTGGDKVPLSLESAAEDAAAMLKRVEEVMWERAQEYSKRLTFRISSREELDARVSEREVGMLFVPWGGDSEDEEKLQEETGLTLRCYPLEQDALEEGQLCPITGKPARIWAVFAPAY